MSLTKMSSPIISKNTQQHGPLVRCFIANQNSLQEFFRRSVDDHADADDLFQKLLLKALKIENTEHIDNLLAYGFRMAKHLVIDHHRDQKNFQKVLNMIQKVKIYHLKTYSNMNSVCGYISKC